MRRRIPVAIAAVAVVVGLAAPASAGTLAFDIEVFDDGYNPQSANIEVGKGVHWFVSAPTDEHNVLATGKLFDSGPLEEEVDYAITPSAGTFAYYCKAHGTKSGHGMAGTLNVKPVEGTLKRGVDLFEVIWAEDADTGNRYDVRWKGPGSGGKYKTWLKNTTDGVDLFGSGNEPTSVIPGKKYSVQVRSEASSNPKKRRSDWSPALKMALDAR